MVRAPPLSFCDGTDGSTRPDVIRALSYCLFASSCFVASLYACVPSSVRRLDRNDPRHVRYRSAATALACVVVAVLYPRVICGPLPFVGSGARPPLDRVGTESVACGTVLLHTSILYLGPMLRNLLLLDSFHRRGRTGAPVLANLREFLFAYVNVFIEPTISSFRKGGGEAWCACRDLIVAPITEEIVFRGCIVSALSASEATYTPSGAFALTTTQVIVVAPLFFGVAHFHHAIVSLRRGQPLARVVLQTLFQFTYTSLFGSYATFVFLKTHSLLAAVLCHSYCNAMGLPDLSFMRSESSPLYNRRWVLMWAHVVGLLSFLLMTNLLYSN